jgi:hypothetical protein
MKGMLLAVLNLGLVALFIYLFCKPNLLSYQVVSSSRFGPF